MPKLKLKRTPEEEAAHQWRKERKAKRKADKASKPRQKRSSAEPTDEGDDGYARSDSPFHKKRRTDEPLYESDQEYGPQPSTPSYKPDYDAIRAQVEEERFREKMYGAMEDDVGIYGVEERLSSFTHIPDRWQEKAPGGRRGAMKDDEAEANLHLMDEEEYAEWIRQGMWKKRHAEEHAEQLRKEAHKAERRARQKAAKAESARLEKALNEEREKHKSEKDKRRFRAAREDYDRAWREILADGDETRLFKFDDIPWPVFAARRKDASVGELKADAIAAFILSDSGGTTGPTTEEIAKKDKKEKLRETMLRFHPDKFEGRVMRRVKESDKDKVREAVGQVARALNALMGEAN